jgi:hypothetical protein
MIFTIDFYLFLLYMGLKDVKQLSFCFSVTLVKRHILRKIFS